MNRWARCGSRAEEYWWTIWGRGLTATICITITMFFVGILLIIDTMLLMPFSVYNAIREKK